MKALAWLRAGLRGWSWRHLGLAMAVAVVTLCANGLPGPLRQAGVAYLYHLLQFALPLVLAVRIADAAVDDGVRRWPAYALAVVGVVALGVWVLGPQLATVLGADPHWTWVLDVALFINVLIVTGLLTAAYAHWRHERRVLAQVRERERLQAEQARDAAAARLKAQQARVDPAVLFDALREVGALIPTAPTAADDRLAELIALLRRLHAATEVT